MRATCNGRMWIWTLGYHLFLDPIIAKSRRIAAIFDTKLQVRKISDTEIAAVAFALMIPQIILNAIHSGIANLQPFIVVLDPLRPSLNWTDCRPSDSMASLVILSLTIAYCGSLLLYACWLSVKGVESI